MKIFLIILSLIVFSASCQTAKPDLVEKTEPKIESTPVPKGEIPELTKEQIIQLDKRISPEIRKILENAEEFEVKSISGWLPPIDGKLNKNLKENVKKVNDKNLMNRIIKAIFYDIATSQGGAVCYTPRHNLYAKIGKEWVNLEICYECSNLRGKFSGESFYTPINDTFSKEIFDKILQNAKEIK
jgi:hypothetical protein